MIDIIKMWLMVRRVYKLADQSMLEQGTDSPLTGEAAILARSKLNQFVRKDLLCLMEEFHFPITAEEAELKKSDLTKQRIIDRCLDEGFLAPHQHSASMVAITGKGLKFMIPSYLLKNLIEELGIILTYVIGIATGLAGLGLFSLIKKGWEALF